jgi:hypothetical protein
MFSKREFLFIILGIVIFLIISFSSNTKKEKKKEKEEFTLEQDILKEKITYGLSIIDKIFNAHNIYYTIAYGTLLGAVRHSDMIPWDDDADIIILRKDFDSVIKLKDEFKKYGLIIEEDWKLIKVYFDDTKFPFIDIFIYDDENGKIVRCCEPFKPKCNYIDKVNDWWWKDVNYPSEWILEKKRYKFGEIEVWGPKEAEKVLSYLYGSDCLTKCKTHTLDHITGIPIQAKDIGCGELPALQL